jgi:putative hydrolase of the HAD superfamily
MNKKTKAIIFDYGGTLDTDGIHWSEKFWEAYTHFNLNIPKEEFRNAFIYSERKIPEIIKKDFSLLKTYQTQIAYQFEYLIRNKIKNEEEKKITEQLSNYCYNEVLKNIPKTKELLNKLKSKYMLGLVSNYYGNVKTVLAELGLANYFEEIVDSAVIGIRKPDEKIFEHIIKKLKLNPNEIIVVGDSYKNDIAPAKRLGCKTIWIKVKGWVNNENTDKADMVVKSLKEINDIL